MNKGILARQIDGEIQLTITIPASVVESAYRKVFEETAQKTELPGFRTGKAPKKLVEEKIDKSKAYEQVIQEIIPQAYVEALEEHNLKPIISPKVELLKAKEGEDWEIRCTTCEAPKVILGDYKSEIRKELAGTKLWTPGNTEALNEDETLKDGNKNNTEDEKTQKVIQVLLQNCQVALPQILTDNEINRALSNLISQTEKLGMTIDQYLNSIGKSAEQLRAVYKAKVEEELKMQFILDAVVDAEKTEVQDKEIDDLIAASGDEKIKNDLNTPNSRAYLKGIISRRKTLDSLTNIVGF